MRSKYHHFPKMMVEKFNKKKKRKKVFIPMGIKKENQHDKILLQLHKDDGRKKFNKV